MPTKTEYATEKDLDSAENMLGKRLLHVRYSEDHDGIIFCFGESSEDTEGPMLFIRIEPDDDTINVKSYAGTWRDHEEVVYESKSKNN